MTSNIKILLLIATGAVGGSTAYAISNAFDFENFSLAKLAGAIVVGVVVSCVSSKFSERGVGS